MLRRCIFWTNETKFNGPKVLWNKRPYSCPSFHDKTQSGKLAGSIGEDTSAIAVAIVIVASVVYVGILKLSLQPRRLKAGKGSSDP